MQRYQNDESIDFEIRARFRDVYGKEPSVPELQQFKKNYHPFKGMSTIRLENPPKNRFNKEDREPTVKDFLNFDEPDLGGDE